jgi:hypothetical protein
VTAQVPEQLILDGVRTWMAFCPPLPQGHPRIVEPADDDRNGGSDDVAVTRSTACWRRYVGTWEIRQGRLYLIRLVGQYELAGVGPLFADWFTGVLRIPRGEVLLYVHMGFGSLHEEELHIRIEAGVVVDRRIVDNRRTQPDRDELAMQNLPGGENDFAGDDDWD